MMGKIRLWYSLLRNRKRRFWSAISLIAFFLSMQLIGQFIPFFGTITQKTQVFSPQEVYAQPTSTDPTGATSTDNSGNIATDVGNLFNQDLNELLEIVNKTVYILLRPSLAISGAGLSNDLVYGKAFKLDRSLWKFWQIMRTFANFTLGFLFVGSILYAFIRQKEDKEWIKTLFRRTVLAGVLINMSWGIMAALIDLSTVGVVAVGGLPLQVFDNGEENVLNEVSFLKPHSFLDMQPSDDEEQDLLSHSIVYSCGDKTPEGADESDSPESTPPDTFYIPCMIENGKFVDQGQYPVLEPRTFMHQIEVTNKARERFEGIGDEDRVNVTGNISNAFCVYGGELLGYEAGANINDRDIYEEKLELGKKEKEAQECPLLGKFVTMATESTGPLYTLYTSIFLLPEVGMTSKLGSMSEVGLQMMMKSIIGIALLLPLIILAVVLVIRVVYLWVIIAFSPLLVLAYVFEFKAIEKQFEGKFTKGNIISLIFLPVFAVFALSISLVFMGLLSNITLIEMEHGKADQAQQQEVGHNDISTILRTVTRVESDNESHTCYDFLGIQEVCFSEATTTFGNNIVNVLTWAVTNMFGIAIMWMVVMFIFKSNKITESIAGDIGRLGKQALMSVPIIPYGEGGISLGGIGKASKDLENTLDKYQRDQFDSTAFKSFMNNKKLVGSEDHTKAVNDLSSSPGGFVDGTQEAIDHTHGGNYDAAVPNIVNDLNTKIKQHNKNNPNDTVKELDTNIGSMQELTKNGDFWTYIDKSGKDGFTEEFLPRRDKTADHKFNKEWSDNFRAGIMNAYKKAKATDSNAFYFDDDTNSSGKKEFIYANGKMKTFQWETKSGNKRINKKSVKVYDLPAPGSIESRNDLEQFSSFASNMGGIKQLPDELYNKYVTGKIQDAIDEKLDEAGVDEGTIEIMLGGENISINAAREPSTHKITKVSLSNI